MGKKDPRVDAYIARSAEFARPILTYLREIVHTACPEVVESIKWGMPSFGRKGILCHMAAFKAHAAFGFWNHEKSGDPESDNSMGEYGRITSLKDLPSKKVLLARVKKAVELDEQGVKSPTRAKAAGPKKALPIPEDLGTALSKNKKARAAFEGFTDAQRREYIEWITSAKREETRQSRLATAVEWIGEGKTYNWKYK